MPSSQESGLGLKPQVALAADDQLGEGPHWDQSSQELIRVDISNGLVHRWQPETAPQRTLALGAPVSFAIPRERGGLVVGRQHTICEIADDGSNGEVAALDERPDDVRFNDAKCDRLGRLWAGTMSTTRRPGAGALYRFEDGRGLETVVEGTTISNGIGWSPDSRRMYFIDSPTQRVDVFDFDLTSGQPANRRPFVQIDAEDGLPDGLAVDARGHVWVCLFGGGAIREYTPDGELESHVALPVSNPTSPCFGGSRLGVLYITTAKHRLSPERLAAEGLAGAVLELRRGASGLPANRFAG